KSALLCPSANSRHFSCAGFRRKIDLLIHNICFLFCFRCCGILRVRGLSSSACRNKIRNRKKKRESTAWNKVDRVDDENEVLCRDGNEDEAHHQHDFEEVSVTQLFLPREFQLTAQEGFLHLDGNHVGEDLKH